VAFVNYLQSAVAYDFLTICLAVGWCICWDCSWNVLGSIPDRDRNL